MNKLAIAFFALVLVTLSASSQASNPYPAQTRCNLTEATAPSVRGLRLGMTTQQLLAVFPSVMKKKEMKDAAEKAQPATGSEFVLPGIANKKEMDAIDKAKSATGNEAVYLGFDPASDGADRQQFAGVTAVSAAVYKARVVDFGIQYDGATWRNIDEWVAKVSESLVLPGKDSWVTGPSEHPNKVLRCDGIEIEAGIQGGGSSIRVTNTAYFRAIEEQGRAAEDKKRQQVKP